MTKETAKDILSNSIKDLTDHNDKISIKELEKEVIFLSCLEILKNRKKKTSKTDFLSEWSEAFSDSLLYIVPVSKAFTEAAMEIFPSFYTHSHAINASEIIKTKIFEEDMWDILKSYFLDTHDYDIDEKLLEEDGVPKFVMLSTRQLINKINVSQNVIEIAIKFVGENKIKVSLGKDIKDIYANLFNENDWYNLEYVSSQSEYKFIIRYDKSYNPSSLVVINQIDNNITEYFY